MEYVRRNENPLKRWNGLTQRDLIQENREEAKFAQGTGTCFSTVQFIHDILLEIVNKEAGKHFMSSLRVHTQDVHSFVIY